MGRHESETAAQVGKHVGLVTRGHQMKPAGKRKRITITTAPSSGWRPVSDLESWKKELPAAYVYRARVVDASGNAVHLPRLHGSDVHGLLYIGQTGPKKGSPRLHALGKELIDRANGYCGHGVGKRFWQFGVNVAIENLCDNFELQVGWDECKDFDGPANEDVRHDAPLPGPGSISSSRKEIARDEEGRLLDEYCRQYAELPPLNHQVGEYMRDEDQLTGQDVTDDFHPSD